MGILIFGTLWFWATLLLAIILVIYFIEEAIDYEKFSYKTSGGGTKVTVTILACLTLYFFFGSKEDLLNLLFFVKDHPIWSVVYILGYVLLGVIWSITKWYLFLQGYKAYNEFHGHKITKNHIPTAARNKNRIITWMSYWPFSLLWTILNEPARKFYTYLYTKISSVYDKMAKTIFSDIKTED